MLDENYTTNLVNDLFAELSEVRAELAKVKTENDELKEIVDNCCKPTQEECIRLEKENRRLRDAIEDEPELPGEIPEEMYQALQGDRDACTECLRIIVRQTKQGIKERANIN